MSGHHPADNRSGQQHQCKTKSNNKTNAGLAVFFLNTKQIHLVGCGCPKWAPSYMFPIWELFAYRSRVDWIRSVWACGPIISSWVDWICSVRVSTIKTMHYYVKKCSMEFRLQSFKYRYKYGQWYWWVDYLSGMALSSIMHAKLGSYWYILVLEGQNPNTWHIGRYVKP